MEQGVKTWAGHGVITCVLQTQFSRLLMSFFFLSDSDAYRNGNPSVFLARYQLYRVSLQYGLKFHFYFPALYCLEKFYNSFHK